MTVKHFTAAKALIRRNGKILLLRESNKYEDGNHIGKYDVPGGRLDPGEELLDGLHREISEECGLKVVNPLPIFDNKVVVNKRDEEWHIHRHYFACDALEGDVIISNDHDQFMWCDPREYASVPIIENLNVVLDAYLKKVA